MSNQKNILTKKESNDLLAINSLIDDKKEIEELIPFIDMTIKLTVG